MKKILIPAVISLLLISLAFDTASAKTWQVEIPTGAADPNAPFFFDPWELSVQTFDRVEWQNGDTQPHTVTSGTSEGGPDGRFDSDLFGPGKTFSYQFLEKDAGVVKYYCLIHPFMVGTINVGELEGGFQILHNVGSEVGDGKKTFDVQYSLSRSLDSAKVDSTRNLIIFTLAGIIENDELVLKLPDELIHNPHSVWVDQTQITNFESESKDGITTLKIPLEANTETVSVMGSSVVPEFGPIAAIVFAIAIISTIIVSKKNAFAQR